MAISEVEALAASSRTYGADLNFVFLGGGNTSYKTEDRLYIKPSGVTLADISGDDFIAMSRVGIRELYRRPAPADEAEREAFVKQTMAAATIPCGAGRPSVEAPLHELMAYRHVVHLHPAKVNGMTCAAAGAAVCKRLFPEALWVDYIDPGATLALHIKTVLDAVSGPQPKVIFLQNHGVFVAADELAEIAQIYDGMMAKLEAAYAAAGVATELRQVDGDLALASAALPSLRGALQAAGSLPVLTTAPSSFAVADGPLTPDHMVYARSFPCRIQTGADDVVAYVAKHGMQPRVLVLPGGGVIGLGASLKAAHGVLIAACDAALVGQLSQAFGGPRYLSDHERLFIENWEVESYRQSVAAGDSPRRLAGRIGLVTGGAQGFGLGIAQGLVREGAVVALADINLPAAEAAAEAINQTCGAFSAFAVEVDIAQEASVENMVREVVLACGGVDLLVANAGVLKAGSVKTLPLADWELVTKVNYSGYFLCTKHVAPVMAVQNAVCEGYWTDIVQINSKSGLEGSNRNGAYAGSKFGTIGLTQSFALELVADRIKVNSVCPGNFFDGPLWSDPDRGLFVQYLNSGKVPGAKTVADVKAFYEAKVPMGRGCHPEDVMHAILYLVAQTYETGQALPVTGGQVMLN